VVLQKGSLRVSLAIATCLVIMTAAKGQDDAGYVMDYRGRVQGKNISFCVTQSDLQQSPSWEPGDKIQVSIQAAIKLAEKEVERQTQGSKDWSVSKVSIEYIGLRVGMTGKWIIIVELTRRGHVTNDYEYLNVPILLTGRAIEGRQAKE
jgi:hypothetical protein